MHQHVGYPSIGLPRVTYLASCPRARPTSGESHNIVIRDTIVSLQLTRVIAARVCAVLYIVILVIVVCRYCFRRHHSHLFAIVVKDGEKFLRNVILNFQFFSLAIKTVTSHKYTSRVKILYKIVCLGIK